MQDEGEREVKLKLRRHDHDTLQALIGGSESPTNPSAQIRENYELFRDLLQEAYPEMVYRGINRLLLVDVTLERNVDNPQMIFESLNSTGVDLSPSDLIRNFILMSLQEREQTRLYETYWNRIEALFRGSERVFDNFIRDYLARRSRSGKLERSDRVYVAFRRAFANIGHDPETLEDLLKELLRRARQYAAFAVPGGTDERGRAFAGLHRLGDVPAILVMRLLEAHETSGTLSAAELLEAVRLQESYLLRRAVIGAQTRGYGLEFAKLAYRIDNDRPLASADKPDPSRRSIIRRERADGDRDPSITHAVPQRSWATYDNPTAVAPTHGLASDNPAVLRMQGALEKFSAIAAGM